MSNSRQSVELLRRRRRWRGYWDLGGVPFPFLPPKYALKDRVGGATFEIVKVGASTVPTAQAFADPTGYRVIEAFEGPYVEDGAKSRRLYVSGGTLLSEPAPQALSLGAVFVTVATAPLDVWEVVWDTTTLALKLVEIV